MAKARGPIMKSASLDVILAANGLPTIDDHRRAIAKQKTECREKLYVQTGIYLNASQRKQLRKTMEKVGKDIFGNPLPKLTS